MKSFQSQLDEEKIVNAIGEVELKATAEVRVHLEKKCPVDVMDRAVEVFTTLHMHQTRYRNGVLLYIAYEDHKFAIIGDAGINARVGPDFWRHEKQLLGDHFQKAEYTQGICQCIGHIGDELIRFFPYEPGDTNELPDDISYGDQ
jgi:uncharacterized membrane protein